VLHRVKAAAEAAGAQAVEGLPEDACGPGGEGFAHVDVSKLGPPGPLLTVCASAFLADFQFYEADLTVHFRHLSGSVELHDKDVDVHFAALVRTEDYASLLLAFANLVALEELDAHVRPSLPSLKSALRAFEDDLLVMHASECASFPGTDNTLVRDSGHGLMRRSAHGLRISFSATARAVISVEHAHPARWITVGSVGPVPAVTAQFPTVLPLSFIYTLNPPQVATVAAQYVLLLERPIVASTAFATNLFRLTRTSEAIFASPQPSAEPETPVQACPAVLGSLTDPTTTTGKSTGGTVHTMEGLLVPEVFGPEQQRHGQQARCDSAKSKFYESNALSGGTEIVTRAAVLADKHLRFSFSRVDCSSGVQIHRVPLAHPQDLARVLKLLRQHLVFNALFTSCFGGAASVPQTSKAELDQPVEVVVCDAPGFIHFAVYDPAEDTVLGVAVNIGLNGCIDARIRGPCGTTHNCSNAKASALFAATLSAPLALHAIRTVAQSAVRQPQPRPIVKHEEGRPEHSMYEQTVAAQADLTLAADRMQLQPQHSTQQLMLSQSPWTI
jgi:Mediator of RNA polymerase II transcription subunit 1